MAGIVFFKTQQIDTLEKFYTGEIGMQVWLRQEDCIILRHGNLLLGFCARQDIECAGMMTFFYETVKEVDAMYDRLKDIATELPAVSEKYNICRFFSQDPERRRLEFQCFLHPVDV
ncbi:VOC family protein [candidate division WOR-3 bacterium]|nr:VOC family protein [candidate division WOR-3 bacterium]